MPLKNYLANQFAAMRFLRLNLDFLDHPVL